MQMHHAHAGTDTGNAPDNIITFFIGKRSKLDVLMSLATGCIGVLCAI